MTISMSVSIVLKKLYFFLGVYKFLLFLFQSLINALEISF